MHETLNRDIKGYIDDKVVKCENGKQILYVKGWSFHNGLGVIKLRVYYDSNNEINNDILIIDPKERKDVSSFYRNFMLNECGWEFKVPFYSTIKLQGYVNNIWNDIFEFNPYNFSINKKQVSTFVVVDNFYEDPDSVRRYALEQAFYKHPDAHKGSRTESLHRFEGLKERFEHILNVKIKNWDHYGTNACFQYCIKGDEIVYHQDGQQYAGVLYLTPDAPANCGTSLYRSKETGKMSNLTEEDFSKAFKHGFLDGSHFELIDVVGNIYNRLILFNSKTIHAASEYFGSNKEDGRLFQLFFFDLDV